MWTRLFPYSLLVVAICFLLAPDCIRAQADEEELKEPKTYLQSPYDAVYNHLYYVQDGEDYTPRKSGLSFRQDVETHLSFAREQIEKDIREYNESNPNNPINTKGERKEAPLDSKIRRDLPGERAIQLKQILDGKGLQVRVGLIPENPNYLDSSSYKHVYVLFPKQLPEVYLKRIKLNATGTIIVNGEPKEQELYAWVYSEETIKAIPKLHKKVYPLGSDKLLGLLPQFGTASFLGLKIWQYISVAILILVTFLLRFIVSRVLGKLIQFLADTKLGQDHFDREIVKKIAKLLSYLVATYVFYVFLPVLQLHPSLSYYIIAGLRLYTTFLIILLVIRAIELANSYFEQIVTETENASDDQLLPIVVRILKVVVWIAGLMQMLSILGVNVTALIAGLSIGGLAIALAAQETVKSLIGSAMIYADKPFQVGDFISTGTVVGKVVDVGFRSTRIRTPDTSIITVPNGSLADMIVDNLGAREFRRFNTNITIAYHTPPDLIEQFVYGLREVKRLHPKTLADPFYIHLNNLSASSIDILFVVYFATSNYDEELELKEQILFSILRLAEALNVQMAFPSTSVYVETIPNVAEGGSAIPKYNTDKTSTNKALSDFLEDFKKRHPLPKDYEDKFMSELRSGGQEK